MPGLVWDAYWQALPALRAERSLLAVQVAAVPHLKQQAARAILRGWSAAANRSRQQAGNTVQEVRSWLGKALGGGLGR